MKHMQERRGLMVRGFAALALILAAAWGGFALRRPGHAQPAASTAQMEALGALTNDVRGVLVYQRESATLAEGIYVAELGRTDGRRLADGRYPRWSPTGSHIAFLHGSNVVVMAADGASPRTVATTTVPAPRALAWHPGGGEVWFTDGTSIRAADIRSGAVRTVVTGSPFRGLDVAVTPDGTHLVATIQGHRILAYHIETGAVRDAGVGCSANLSPDGTQFTHLSGSHRHIRLRRWSDLSDAAEFDAPEDLTLDNEQWSNDPRWVISRGQRKDGADLCLHDPGANRTVQVTFTGDCNRPDFFVPPAAGR